MDNDCHARLIASMMLAFHADYSPIVRSVLSIWSGVERLCTGLTSTSHFWYWLSHLSSGSTRDSCAKQLSRPRPAGKGEQMTGIRGWRLATTKGKKRVFVATLLKTFHFGDRRLAVFSVPK
jgi:hypothetical protein